MFQTVSGANFVSVSGSGTDVWLANGSGVVYRRSGTAFTPVDTRTGVNLRSLLVDAGTSKVWAAGATTTSEVRGVLVERPLP